MVRIEKKAGKSGAYLQGDNLKYIASLTLSGFHVIDLDAFGVPFAQLEQIWNRLRTDQRIAFTFIQSGMGQLPKGLLSSLGITREMSSKCPALFNRNGFEKLKAYLSINGVRQIQYLQFDRKIYGTFRL